jgi:ankyrin repeat protein
MGNRTSSASTNPGAPPPLLAAAVTGKDTEFAALWKEQLDPTQRGQTDSQNNNILHALFSCRVASSGDGPTKILRIIHTSLRDEDPKFLCQMYKAHNALGCTPLWILVAYGNTDLLQIVLQDLKDANLLQDDLPTLLSQPNYQGDTPLLATCSQGNLSMVKFLANQENMWQPDWLKRPNKKSTTPLQIVVANGHTDLLQYLLQQEEHMADNTPLWQPNSTAGLTLWHVCAERNFVAGLHLLWQHCAGKDNHDNILTRVTALKDRNGANPWHVAGFCGNVEVVQVWLDFVQQSSQANNAKWIIDATDGQGRTVYWLAMVQGHDAIGSLLEAAGAQTKEPARMIDEIQQAASRRASRRQQQPPSKLLDGNALLQK